MVLLFCPRTSWVAICHLTLSETCYGHMSSLLPSTSEPLCVLIDRFPPGRLSVIHTSRYLHGSQSDLEHHQGTEHIESPLEYPGQAHKTSLDWTLLDSFFAYCAFPCSNNIIIILIIIIIIIILTGYIEYTTYTLNCPIN